MTVYETTKRLPAIPNPVHSHWIRWAGSLSVLLFYCVAMTIASHLPIDFSRPTGMDKVLHFAAFGGLAFLASRLCQRGQWSWRRTAVILLVVVAFASVDEWSQIWVPLRVCDLRDWLADVSGTCTGLAACLLKRPRDRD
ncbi:MAG: VanZ family protein [Pirellulaceae bacterium]